MKPVDFLKIKEVKFEMKKIILNILNEHFESMLKKHISKIRDSGYVYLDDNSKMRVKK